jgi:predicted FMN-binding regulatory protein PaiB
MMSGTALQKRQTTEASSETFDTKSVVKKLESLMHDVTKDKATPETVNAACNCAGRITEILRIHLEVERLKGRFK